MSHKQSLIETGGSAVAIACLALVVGPARGHVVPPEKLHRVAEAYRRATFILNLNPVNWEQVSLDVAAIADYRRGSDPEAAGKFEADARRLIARATTAGHLATGESRLPRREAAALVFGLLTRAVNEIAQQKLALTGQDLGSREPVRLVMRETQGIFGAFDDTLRIADPRGSQHLGRQWLEMSSALGAAGLLGRGAVDVDRRRFREAAGRIASYMNSNFGAGFQPLAGRKLAPWPARSPTFDASATLPPKLPPGHNINKQLPRPRQILNMVARGVDERETVLIALGDMAFDSSFIFGNPARALGINCNTCHNKSITNPNFFIPGLSRRPGGMDVSNSFFAPHANNGYFDPLDIPDLRGIRFTAPYGRNGRFESLSEFVRNVIVNEFNGPEPDPMLLDGLLAYMLEFDFLPNPFLEADGTLTEASLPSARRGEQVFNRPFEQMGGMSCATCHIPSANFVDHKRHDIGTVAGTEPFSRDRALATPTLLGIRHTAPYFHDGRQPTLRAVNEWFNDSFRLNLTEGELSDLTSYLQTVGDGAEPYEETVFTLEAEMEEFSFFLATYELLIQKQKPQLAGITFLTVAYEIRAHKWDLQDWTHMPVLERMAIMMDEAYAAIVAGDHRRADELVREYRRTYARYRDVLI